MLKPDDFAFWKSIGGGFVRFATGGLTDIDGRYIPALMADFRDQLKAGPR